jgi:regulator of nucleoside diphosphate kinase
VEVLVPNARELALTPPPCAVTRLDDICTVAVSGAEATRARRVVAYVPGSPRGAIGCWNAALLARAVKLLVEEVLHATSAAERVELRWRLDDGAAVISVQFPRPLGSGQRLVTFFDADARAHEDRRRLVAARDALIAMGGTLARVRTRRGTTYVATVARCEWTRFEDVERNPHNHLGGTTMAHRIYISEEEATRLRDLVDQHSAGRDAATVALLASELDRATVVAPERVPSDAVTIGSRVVFEEESSGRVREVVLVYPSDADASAGRISVLAPIGAALLGLRVGDEIDWPLPAGRMAEIRILSVEAPQHAAAEVA